MSRAAPAVLVELLRHREALGAGRHEEHRDAVLVVGVGLRGDDRHVAVDGVGDERLRAVDPPAVAVLAPPSVRMPATSEPASGSVTPIDRIVSPDSTPGSHSVELLGRAGVDEVRARHVGVHEHGHVEAGVRRRAERLGEGGRRQHARARARRAPRARAGPSMPSAPILSEHLARDLAGLLPCVAVRRRPPWRRSRRSGRRSPRARRSCRRCAASWSSS